MGHGEQDAVLAAIVWNMEERASVWVFGKRQGCWIGEWRETGQTSRSAPQTNVEVRGWVVEGAESPRPGHS